MKYILIIFVFFFNACSIKEYKNTQTKIIIIKSPKLKFGDVGYIRNTDKSIELELFVAGNVIEKITINHLICVTKGCMDKSTFNQEYLNSSYPTNILQNILLANEIYSGKNKQKTNNGFKQNIKNKEVDIIYKVSKNLTYFKDKKNKIIFKIKDTK